MLRLLWYLIVGYDWKNSTPSKFPMILNFGDSSIYLLNASYFKKAFYENGEVHITWYSADGHIYNTKAKCEQIEFESQLMRLK